MSKLRTHARRCAYTDLTPAHPQYLARPVVGENDTRKCHACGGRFALFSSRRGWNSNALDTTLTNLMLRLAACPGVGGSRRKTRSPTALNAGRPSYRWDIGIPRGDGSLYVLTCGIVETVHRKGQVAHVQCPVPVGDRASLVGRFWHES